MSLYQLAFLDSVPDSAAVNEGVKLTRTMKAASASGFVNAVLRAFLRDGKELPPIKGGQLRQWEVRYSCPQWIIRSLQQSYGEQAQSTFWNIRWSAHLSTPGSTRLGGALRRV